MGRISLYLLICIANCIVQSFCGSSLQCYTCAHYEFLSDTDSVVSTYFSDMTDQSCLTVSQSDTLTSECPQKPDSRCGSVNGEVTAYTPKGGEFQIKVSIRECLQVNKEELNGCHGESDVNELLSNTLTFVPDIEIRDFRGDLCFCDTDHCVTTECPQHHYTVPSIGDLGKCVHLGVLVAAGFGLAITLVTFLLLLVYCCNYIKKAFCPIKAPADSMSYKPQTARTKSVETVTTTFCKEECDQQDDRETNSIRKLQD